MGQAPVHHCVCWAIYSCSPEGHLEHTVSVWLCRDELCTVAALRRARDQHDLSFRLDSREEQLAACCSGNVTACQLIVQDELIEPFGAFVSVHCLPWGSWLRASNCGNRQALVRPMNSFLALNRVELISAPFAACDPAPPGAFMIASFLVKISLNG